MYRAVHPALGSILAAIVLAAGALPCAAHETAIKDLRIVHPHTVEPTERLPKVLPVYMTIRNGGGTSDRLIAVRSDHSTSAVLVTSLPVNGSASPALELPAFSETVLGPKGAFIELKDLKETLEGYEYFTAFLTFEKAGTVEIEIYVEERN